MTLQQMIAVMMDSNADSDRQHEVAQELAWYITPNEFGDGSTNSRLVDWLWGSYQFIGNETEDSLWSSWLNR